MSDTEIFAIEYARRFVAAADMFFRAQTRVAGPQPMAYFVWSVRTGGELIVVDAGFRPAAAHRRNQPVGMPLDSVLVAAGIDPTEVRQILLTHLHWDHCGNVDMFPNARITVQRAEWEFWNTALAARPAFATAHEEEDMVALRRLFADGRVVLVDGDITVAPGVSCHLVRGHTPGMQVVRVEVGEDAVVLASDAVHTTLNLELDLPSRTLVDVRAVLLGYDRIRALASDPRLIVPGHDAKVHERFASPDPSLAGRVAVIRDPR